MDNKMDNNDIMRRLRFALKLSDKQIVDIFGIANFVITEKSVISILKKEEDENFLKCTNDMLNAFLDGLIIQKRGKSDDTSKEKVIEEMSNNIVLKKLKIALNIKSEEIQAILLKEGVEVSNSEISAVMRRAGHRNYKECGDRYLRNFLKGLAEYKS
jgi:uncharacterized protein YehS (DUF1456 family)